MSGTISSISGDRLNVYDFLLSTDGVSIKPISTSSFEDDSLKSCCFNHTNQVVVVGGSAKRLSLVQVGTGQILSTIPFTDPTTGSELFPGEIAHGIDSVSFSPTSRYLAAGAGGNVYLYDLKRRVLKNCYKGLRASSVPSVAFTMDGDLVAGDSLGTIKIWDQKTDLAREMTLPVSDAFPQTSLMQLDISPSGALRIAAGYADGSLGIWDPLTLQLLRRQTVHTGALCSVSYSPKNPRLVATAGSDGRLALIDTGSKTNSDPSAVCEVGDRLTSASFNEDAIRCAVGTNSGSILVYDWRNVRKPVCKIDAHNPYPVVFLQFNHPKAKATEASSSSSRKQSSSSGSSSSGSNNNNNNNITSNNNNNSSSSSSSSSSSLNSLKSAISSLSQTVSSPLRVRDKDTQSSNQANINIPSIPQSTSPVPMPPPSSSSSYSSSSSGSSSLQSSVSSSIIGNLSPKRPNQLLKQNDLESATTQRQAPNSPLGGRDATSTSPVTKSKDRSVNALRLSGDARTVETISTISQASTASVHHAASIASYSQGISGVEGIGVSSSLADDFHILDTAHKASSGLLATHNAMKRSSSPMDQRGLGLAPIQTTTTNTTTAPSSSSSSSKAFIGETKVSPPFNSPAPRAQNKQQQQRSHTQELPSDVQSSLHVSFSAIDNSMPPSSYVDKDKIDVTRSATKRTPSSKDSGHNSSSSSSSSSRKHQEGSRGTAAGSVGGSRSEGVGDDEFDSLRKTLRPVTSQELQDALQMLRYDVHREVQEIIKEQVRQFTLAREDTENIIRGLSSQLADLLQANKELRAENERLRRIY